MLTFLKNWTLPIAMLAGVLGYFAFAEFIFLTPIKPFVGVLVTYLTPLLIFAQLLLTFCKVEPHELLPSAWHGWLLLFQASSSMLLATLLIVWPMESVGKVVTEGLLVCLICPTATAAAVITGKLGGSASSLTTYTLLSNLLAAVLVPLLFPMVELHVDISFLTAFLKILGRVFPLLLFPFLLVMLFRYFIPSIHRLLLKAKDLAFYLWSVALMIVMAQTTKSLFTGNVPAGVEIWLVLAGLFTCAVQFFLGKKIGSRYHDRISAGQALGQKNTVLAIWMAYTYLNPLSSVAPGAYVLWQNLFNSWQLWKKRRRDAQT